MGLLDTSTPQPTQQSLLEKLRGLLAPNSMVNSARPTDPRLAEALNNRLALERRMQQAGESSGYIPDQRPMPQAQPQIQPQTAGPRFGKQWTPEELKAQALKRQLMLQQLGQ